MNKWDGNLKTSNLGLAVKKGVAWILAGRGLIFLASFVTTIILARLLEPEDFGVFGIAMIFTGFSTRFGNVGFVHALIQRKEIRDEHVSSLFVINLLIFPCLAGLLIFLSQPIGSFFDKPLAGHVIAVLALVFLTSPFRSVAKALMQRRMNFKGPAVANVVNQLSTMTTSIAFAWAGYGVWSLVYGYLIGRSLNTVILMVYAKWTPSLRYKHAAMKDLFSFGLNMFLKNLLRYSSEKVDYFIIGKQLGATPLGLYEKAFNLMNMTVKEMSVKIGPVLFSAFSKMQEERPRLLKAYHKVTLALSLITYPVLFGLALLAPAMIQTLFGEKWMASVVPLQIMCIAGLMRVHLQVASGVINAMGRVAPEVWIRAFTFVLLAVGCWIGSLWGIVGVAIAVTITTCILTVVMKFYLNSLLGSSWSGFLKSQAPALVASGIMFTVVLLFQEWVKDALGYYSVPMLISSVLVGIISYAAALWIIRPASVTNLIKEFAADIKPMINPSK